MSRSSRASNLLSSQRAVTLLLPICLATKVRTLTNPVGASSKPLRFEIRMARPPSIFDSAQSTLGLLPDRNRMV
jgi:hypothetical protein